MSKPSTDYSIDCFARLRWLSTIKRTVSKVACTGAAQRLSETKTADCCWDRGWSVFEVSWERRTEHEPFELGTRHWRTSESGIDRALIMASCGWRTRPSQSPNTHVPRIENRLTQEVYHRPYTHSHAQWLSGTCNKVKPGEVVHPCTRTSTPHGNRQPTSPAPLQSSHVAKTVRAAQTQNAPHQSVCTPFDNA